MLCLVQDRTSRKVTSVSKLITQKFEVTSSVCTRALPVGFIKEPPLVSGGFVRVLLCVGLSFANAVFPFGFLKVFPCHAGDVCTLISSSSSPAMSSSSSRPVCKRFCVQDKLKIGGHRPIPVVEAIWTALKHCVARSAVLPNWCAASRAITSHNGSISRKLLGPCLGMRRSRPGADVLSPPADAPPLFNRGAQIDPPSLFSQMAVRPHGKFGRLLGRGCFRDLFAKPATSAKRYARAPWRRQSVQRWAEEPCVTKLRRVYGLLRQSICRLFRLRPVHVEPI